jgi:TonB family protein
MRGSWRWGFAVVLSIACMAAARASIAQTRPYTHLLTQKEMQELLVMWQEQYNAVVADVKAGDASSVKRARKRAATLFRDLVDRAITGEYLCQTAGRVLTMLAVAEVGLGDRDAGAWHWQMAQNVAAELRPLEFSDFPDVAPFMKQTLIPEERWEQLRRYLRGDREAMCGTDPQDVVPPSLKKKVAPDYPAGLAGQRIAGQTVVAAFIDGQGMVREPVVQRGCGHVSLDLAAMEALRRWQYEPALRDGKPVRVHLTVTVSFTVPK